ncbi:HutD family protein [Paraburkholderia sp. Ac-20342]|uniref:HutD/Ves family protein n=1 Tax=Paraburkholderia sp. Ac-20342 TaxID=2703889 RepID=UPI00198055CF|nr:HutD family protein [Paraburkholderia sp. Ac-20342]MBN3849296.1 HutD family protein [Paraburkholderia sp. Ac-20342]
MKSAAACAPSAQFFECLALPPQPWANGNGITRTIARGGISDGPEDDVHWRVSLATLSTSADFSRFAGFDRTLLLVDEGTVNLHSQDGQLVARRGQPVHFSGDLQIWSTLSTQPVNVLNVMTRRNACRASVSVLSHATAIAVAPVQLLIALSGQWTARGASLDTFALGPLQGLVIEGGSEFIEVTADGAGAQLVSIDIASLSL